MTPVLWLIPAVLVGLLTAVFAMAPAWRMLKREPLPDLPPTPLERRAWWSAAIGGVMFVLFLVAMVLLDREPSGGTGRIVVSLIAIAGLVAMAVPIATASRSSGSRAGLDERDRAILERVPRGQIVAVLVTLAAWVIYLTERYYEVGQVPVPLLALMFWCCLLVAVLALPIGIVVGYRWR